MPVGCDCLNIKLKIENLTNIKSIDVNLSPEERSHPYFHVGVYQTEKLIETSEVFSQLTQNTVVGSWNICQCLICETYTHSTNFTNGLASFSSQLKEIPSNLLTYNHEQGFIFSPAFNVFLPPQLDVCVTPLDLALYSDIKGIGKCLKKITSQANSFIEKTHCMEQSGMSSEKWRERVHDEEQYLLNLVINSELVKDDNFQSHSHGSSSSKRDASTTTSPTNGNPRLQENGNLSHEESEDELRDMLCDLTLTDVKRPPMDFSEEGVFDMDEEFESQPRRLLSRESPRNQFSDDDLGDIDDTVFSRPTRSYRNPRELVARSAPLNVPAWPRALDDKEIDTRKPYNPDDIASSMRRLARSVRMSSVDAFGDLP